MTSVYLSHAEPRCRPRYCSRKHTCARFLAPLPPSGGSIADFSLDVNWYRSCDKWVSRFNKPLQQPPVKKVHPPL